jgi:hypothetical protein
MIANEVTELHAGLLIDGRQSKFCTRALLVMSQITMADDIYTVWNLFVAKGSSADALILIQSSS